MKKIILPIFLLSLITTSIVSCGNKKTNVDSDYDGLTDDIDPDPNNNRYNFILEKKEIDSEGKEIITKTKEDSFTVDYRDYFANTETYNKNILKFSTYCVNEHNYKPEVPQILNNVYPKVETEQSSISRILAQVGGKNITHINLWDKYKDTNDKHDVSDLYLAHNTITYDNKKHQVFFVVIKSYSRRTGWYSNFDMGATTSDYTNLTGDHEEWLEKQNHKGYDVTAYRLKKEFEQYRNQYIDTDAEVVNYITGQSRGGAVANLLGKKIIDSGQKTLVYCLNPSNTTAENDESVINKYTTIYSFINRDDIVSIIPFKEIGFNLYGKKYYYQLSKHTTEYKEYYKCDYFYNTKHAIEVLTNFLINKVHSREEFYTMYNVIHSNNVIYDTEEEANDAIANMKSAFDYCVAKEYAFKCINFSIVPYILGGYVINWTIRPCLFSYAVLDATDAIATEKSIIEIFYNLIAYKNVLNDFIEEGLNVILPLIDSGDFSIAGFYFAHKICSSVLGIDFIENA